ncbi:MAG: HlyD family efflux transporter periplasmic adaptor subunit, partial [Patescibacteria group bacterium]
VSGTGQTTVSNQMDITPKASGDVIYVGVKNGQEVKAGALIAQIDSRDAEKTIRDAEIALETAKLELEKLLNPPDELDMLQAESAVAAAKKNLEKLITPSASTLAQAENSLISAKDSLTKLKFTQETNYQNTLDAKQKAEDNLKKGYEDSFNAIANAFLDLPTIITELKDILYSEEIAESESSVYRYSDNLTALINTVVYDDRYELEKFINSAESNYKTARARYDENLANYKQTSRYSDKDAIEMLLKETTETVRAMAETVKNETSMLDYWVDYCSRKDMRVFSKVTEYQSDIKSYTSKTSSHLSSLLSQERSLEDDKEAILNAEKNIKELEQNQPLDLAAAERTVQEKKDALVKLKNPEPYDIDAAEIAVKEKKLALQDLKNGADELDIRAKKITVQQKQDALTATQQNLADYYIRAPFNGIIASVNIKKGDSVSSSAIATLITKQKIAEITLNEIDITKVKSGQKANITFDAVPDLNITGQVAEVDTLGTTTQGVVNYGVKIAFDAQDERIKPGMSLSVSIIIDAKTDTLLVPNSAVKGQGNASYVEVLSTGQTEPTEPNSAEAKILGDNINSLPRRQPVTIGLSNDTMTEIISGLNEGNQVVTQTTTSTSAQNQSQQNSGFNPGMMRMIR